MKRILPFALFLSVCCPSLLPQAWAQQTTIVNRWVSPVTKNFMSLPENHYSDEQLTSWGYTSKLSQFEAYRTRPNDGQKYKAVYRWINAKPQGDPCRDFTLTIVAGELTDAQLRSWGYTDKRLQYYVPDFD